MSAGPVLEIDRSPRMAIQPASADIKASGLVDRNLREYFHETTSGRRARLMEDQNSRAAHRSHDNEERLTWSHAL